MVALLRHFISTQSNPISNWHSCGYETKYFFLLLSLGSVVNEVTKNFRLIRDCFKEYFRWMIRFQEVHQKSPDDPRLSENLPRFRRAMFTVGLLVRYFDFSKEQLYEGLQVRVIQKLR